MLVPPIVQLVGDWIGRYFLVWVRVGGKHWLPVVVQQPSYAYTTNSHTSSDKPDMSTTVLQPSYIWTFTHLQYKEKLVIKTDSTYWKDYVKRLKSISWKEIGELPNCFWAKKFPPVQRENWPQRKSFLDCRMLDGSFVLVCWSVAMMEPPPYVGFVMEAI